MSQEQKEKYAQEHYGKSFDELSTNEQRGVGGALKGGDMADPERAPEPPAVKFGEDNE
jgi:hypothetical protein